MRERGPMSGGGIVSPPVVRPRRVGSARGRKSALDNYRPSHGRRREFPSRLIYNHAEAMKRLVWLLLISTLALHAQQGKKKAQKEAQDNPEGTADRGPRS